MTSIATPAYVDMMTRHVLEIIEATDGNANDASAIAMSILVTMINVVCEGNLGKAATFLEAMCGATVDSLRGEVMLVELERPAKVH